MTAEEKRKCWIPMYFETLELRERAAVALEKSGWHIDQRCMGRMFILVVLTPEDAKRLNRPVPQGSPPPLPVSKRWRHPED